MLKIKIYYYILNSSKKSASEACSSLWLVSGVGDVDGVILSISSWLSMEVSEVLTSGVLFSVIVSWKTSSILYLLIALPVDFKSKIEISLAFILSMPLSNFKYSSS